MAREAIEATADLGAGVMMLQRLGAGNAIVRARRNMTYLRRYI